MVLTGPSLLASVFFCILCSRHPRPNCRLLLLLLSLLLQAMFAALDTNGNNFLDAQELANLAAKTGGGLTDKEL